MLAVAFPIADWILCARLPSKIAIYAWNLAAQLCLVTACLFVAFGSGLSLTDLGQTIGNPVRLVAVTIVLAAAAGASVWLNRRQQATLNLTKIKESAARLACMLPVNRREQKVYIAVAITAEICEEFLYRGWLMQLFGAGLGSIWFGLVVSSVAFGLAHMYQGRTGVIGTGVLGLLFGLIFLASGSLLPGQVLHAAIDIINGIALGKRLR